MFETRTATSVDELPAIARWILANRRSDVILFEGEMGAGKTTLIKAVCRELKVEDEVSSPTYSLVNEYFSPTQGSVYHFDLYRIINEEEAMDAGIDEYFYSGNLCLLEWPEKIRNLLPDHYDTIRISVSPEGRHFELNTSQHE